MLGPNTGPIAYFRFHGRNAKDWWRGDRESRYNYLDFGGTGRVGPADSGGGRAGDTYVVYNNHFRGKAVANGLQMKLLLGQELGGGVPDAFLMAYPDLAELLARESAEREAIGQ